MCIQDKESELNNLRNLNMTGFPNLFDLRSQANHTYKVSFKFIWSYVNMILKHKIIIWRTYV